MTLHLVTHDILGVDRESRFFKTRARKVLELTWDLMASHKRSASVSAKRYYAAVGHPSKKWFHYFDGFFERVGYYKVGRYSFSYRPRADRYQELLSISGPNGCPDTFVTHCQANGKSFLVDPGLRSSLPRTGPRLYPWWALMDRDLRWELFLQEHEEGWDYDISNAKPTLLLQVTDALITRGLYPQNLSQEVLRVSTWRRYVDAKETVRQELMADLGLSRVDAKTALQAICNGAQAHQPSLEGIQGIETHPIYLGLRRDFRTMWDIHRDRRLPGERSGEYFSRVYCELEDLVMGAAAEFLEPAVKVWWIHDGFITRTPVSSRDVEQHVLKTTGYKIRLEAVQKTRPSALHPPTSQP